MNSQNIIRFQDVSFSYGEGHLALQGVSLDVAAGEYVAIVGANGSGKSTLAKLACGLLTPAAGSVIVCGEDTANKAERFKVRSSCAMVFQNPDQQSVTSVVRDDVAFGPQNLGLSPTEVADRVNEALRSVDMLDHADRQVATLSGGQRQRIAIAGALAMRPKALVLDEPAAMLDVRGHRQLMDLLDRLHAQGMTIILITHFMEDAARAQRVIALGQGTVAFDEPPAQAFSQEKRLLQLRLELPVSLGGSICQRAPRQPQGEPVITLDHVSFSYDQDVALRDLSLTVRKGAMVGIVGAMGSGKSTLAQLLDALLIAQGGTAAIHGLDPKKRGDRKPIRRKVGLAFQYPESQLFASTVAQDVAFGLKGSGLSKKEISQQVDDALAAVGLDPVQVRDLSPFSLSGGMQRRVALAGILAMGVETLVLDEPAAGLDPVGRKEMRALLTSLNARGMTIVLISHSMEDVALLCSDVMVLDKGCAALAGAPEDVFAPANAAQLEQFGLSLPKLP